MFRFRDKLMVRVRAKVSVTNLGLGVALESASTAAFYPCTLLGKCAEAGEFLFGVDIMQSVTTCCAKVKCT